MAVALTLGARNAALDSGWRTLFSGGKFYVLEGTRPTAPSKPLDDEGDVTVLGEIDLPSPPYSAAAAGQIALTGTWQDPSAPASGTASWGRFVAAGDDDSEDDTQARMDCDVSETGGGGDAIIDDENVVAGNPVNVTACVIGLPGA